MVHLKEQVATGSQFHVAAVNVDFPLLDACPQYQFLVSNF